MIAHTLAWRGACIGAVSFMLLTTSSCGNVAGPEFEFALASRAADRWIQRNPTGWSLSLRSNRSLTRPEWSQPCDANPDSGFTVLRHLAGDTEIDLLFRCPVGNVASVEDVGGAFAYFVLERLPHGISARGWEFRVLTPSTSMSEHVTFSSPTAGRLLVEIETPLFAIHGHSTRKACQPPADAPSPEGCYLWREYRVPLSLSLDVPFQWSRLQ